jgi:hypothetical protein
MKKVLLIAIILGFFIITMPSAKADMFGFELIPTNNQGNPDLSGQLSVEVTSPDASHVLFTFKNNIGIDSSIGSVFFDVDDSLLNSPVIGSTPYTSSGVDFKEKDNGQLPGGNTLTPPFTEAFIATKDGSENNGVDNNTEYLGILYSLSSGKDLVDVIDAINNGNLRIGLHLQSIGTNEGSDAYINTRTTVPVPGAVLLGLIGMAVAVIKLRKIA